MHVLCLRGGERPGDAPPPKAESGKEDNSTISNINVPKDARDLLQKYGVTILGNEIIIDDGIETYVPDGNCSKIQVFVKDNVVHIMSFNKDGSIPDIMAITPDSIKINNIEQLYFGKTISQIRKEAGSFELSYFDYGRNTPVVGDIIFKPADAYQNFIFRFDKKTEKYKCVNFSGSYRPMQEAEFNAQVPVGARKVVTRKHIDNYNRANKKAETDSATKRTAELAADNPERQKAIDYLDSVRAMQMKAIFQLRKLSTDELANEYGLENAANAKRFEQEESDGLDLLFPAYRKLLTDGKMLVSEVKEARIDVGGGRMAHYDLLKGMDKPGQFYDLLAEDVAVARKSYLPKMNDFQAYRFIRFMLTDANPVKQ